MKDILKLLYCFCLILLGCAIGFVPIFYFLLKIEIFTKSINGLFISICCAIASLILFYYAITELNTKNISK